MNKLIKIFTLLLFAGIVSSCAKDELEEPSQVSDFQAIETKIEHDKAEDNLGIDIIDSAPTSTPASINDDGDDEDEDRTLIGTGVSPE